MRPVLCKGHERPLTHIKYTAEGDIFFSCAKDHHPTAWYSDTGERLGTYIGHQGAVWSCDVTRDGHRLFTASADTKMKMWEMNTGVELHSVSFDGPCKYVELAAGEREILVTTDPFMGYAPAINIMTVSEDRETVSEPIVKIPGPPQKRIIRACWGQLNKTIISAGEDGIVRIWDVETQKCLVESDAHKKQVSDLQFSADRTHFITASLDKVAKLWDAQTLDVLKTYPAERPLNAACISPLMNHVIVGGGQDASQVTTTAGAAGKFESQFYHKIYEENLGSIKGHFGPINALAMHPDGRSFVSGGEDGYIRVHHFDADYFTPAHMIREK
mmetsp:Transcript_19495/g.23351  ORF Transcript_19495/g.23351 Transcript_19495/m.23351 type:complete len:329 (-) Transcript_19495:228-1214(-)